jgi:hypothetical protein
MYQTVDNDEDLYDKVREYYTTVGVLAVLMVGIGVSVFLNGIDITNVENGIYLEFFFGLAGIGVTSFAICSTLFTVVLYYSLLTIEPSTIGDFMRANMRFMALPNFCLVMSLAALTLSGVLISYPLYNLGLLLFCMALAPFLLLCFFALLYKLISTSFVAALDQMAKDSFTTDHEKNNLEKITQIKRGDIQAMMKVFQRELTESFADALARAKKK